MNSDLTNFQRALEIDAQSLRHLADCVARTTSKLDLGLDVLTGLSACGGSFRDQERRLDQSAWGIRQRWLGYAHRPADATPKSPCAGERSYVAAGDDVDFGYERTLDLSVLERDRAGYSASYTGWISELVLFRSGQAALAALLQYAIGRWGKEQPIAVGHNGAYFETRALLDLYPGRILESGQSHADVAIIEPVWCDGTFGCSRDHISPRYAAFIDTTMVGPAHDISRYLDEHAPSLVVAYNSGLKLDQAGLELANVGIVRIYTRNTDAGDVANALRNIRGLTGTSLTLDELSALSAPWFMDRTQTDTYTAGIFANNLALASAIGTSSHTFADKCHPALHRPGAHAPFCAIQLRKPTPDRYRTLLARVEYEIERRDLLAANGGSFGFRGHRYELIEPKADEGSPFLRVALGWRDGFSRQGLCEMFEELSSTGI